MTTTKNSPPFFFFFVFFFFPPLISAQLISDDQQQHTMSTASFGGGGGGGGGEWVVLQSSIGLSAMHMQLLPNDDHVLIFDRTDFGPSQLLLPSGLCRFDPDDLALTTDCTAHSLLFHLPSNSLRPLFLQTDTWCSSASLLPNGSLLQTGGFNDGDRAARIFSPCPSHFNINFCDWIELPDYLSVRRWYASNQLLPDGRVIVVGGRRQYNYEFFPRNSSSTTTTNKLNYYLGFLQETTDFYDENNLYPFLHLLPDGNLFVFANRRSILLDYVNHRVLKQFPAIPGQEKRNYPSTGSSVLLPLRLFDNSQTQSPEAEVMVCGGAQPGAFRRAEAGDFVGASRSCGRLKVSDPNPNWVMEKMPMPRVMPDMLLLPTGDIIIINGAANGTAGWESAMNPVLNPVLYRTYEPDRTRRFAVLNPSEIPRLYHSSAVVLADGRILVGGSNPHRYYNFTGVLYPTELSLEAFSPEYLAPQYVQLRPTIVSVGLSAATTLLYRQMFTVTFFVSDYPPEQGISVTLLAPSFTTHSFAMNQRLVVLNVVSFLQTTTSLYQVSAVGPTHAAIAPPGYYLLFLVHMGIPSRGVWVKIE